MMMLAVKLIYIFTQEGNPGTPKYINEEGNIKRP